MVFLSDEEKELFQKLISVSGIGPKSAVSILANDDVNGFIQAVESSNITYLTKFPGVGKKTAQQIVLDLKGKFTNIVVKEEATPVVETATGIKQLEEAREAFIRIRIFCKRNYKSLERARSSCSSNNTRSIIHCL